MQRVAERRDRTPEVRELETENHVGARDELAAARGLVQRVLRREVHPSVLIDHWRLDRFGELNQLGDAGGRARGAVRDDHRVLRVDEQACGFGHGARIALRRRRLCQLRYPQAGGDLGGDRILLQAAVDHHEDRRHRRRHGNLVGAHRRLGEVRQRHRVVVPLGKVANHRRGVLDAVRPLDAWPPHGGIQGVAGEHVHRDAVAVGVVDRHRGVLQADRAVAQHGHRLTLGLEVGVRHRDRRLLVQAGDELRLRVVAVVDDRFVDTAEARARVRGDVLEVERLEHVDHEVAAGPIDRDGFVIAGRVGFAWRNGRGRWRLRRRRGLRTFGGH